MLSHNLDIFTNNGKTEKNEHTDYRTGKCNIGDIGDIDDTNEDDISKSNVLKTNINLESLNIVNIKKETYYKMKFIMNSLEKNWAIKKRKTIFYLKNLDNSTTEFITEDYLNKRIIRKIYNGQNHPEQDHNNLEVNLQTKALPNKKKEDIIPLHEGILTLKMLIDKGKMDINKELKNDIYLMIFLMNTLENGWSIRKKNDKFVFRKKHENQKEIYSDEYLVNFLKSNMNNLIY